MADDRESGHPGQPKRVSVSFPVGTESTAAAGATTAANVEATTASLGGLEDLSDNEARAFYVRALSSLPTTRAQGFYGVVDGGPERADDVVLLMYDRDKMIPILKLTMNREDLARFSAALAALVSIRVGRD